MTGSLHTIDGRSVLRFERRLHHPREKVWRALTDPAQLKHWFPSAMEMELQPGAKIRFTFPDAPAEQAYQDGEILELDPPRLFAYTWEDSILRWELQPAGDGCLLIFTQTFDDRPYAASYATGWESCLGALASLLDGTPVSNQPEAYPRRHEEYAAAFGLGEGAVRAEHGGWTARLERLLPWQPGTVRPEAESDWEVTSAGPAGTQVVISRSALDDAEKANALLAQWRAELASISDRLLHR